MTNEQPSGFAFYEKVATDAGRNITFAFIGCGIIWLVSRFWFGAAKVLFWVTAAVTALGVVHFLLVTSAGAIAFATKRLTPLAQGHPGWKWLWAGTATRLLEQILWLAARVVGVLP